MRLFDPFVRSPREGGYTFVTAPGWPGFSMLLEPGEDETELRRVFRIFKRHERRAWWRMIFHILKP